MFKTLFVLSICLTPLTHAFKFQTSERNLQTSLPKSLSLKIKEVESTEFSSDIYCGGYDAFGLCSICYDAYLDFQKKKCVPVERKIPKCLSYDQNNLCLVCEFGFRITGKGDSCRPNKDPNCLVENSKSCEVR